MVALRRIGIIGDVHAEDAFLAATLDHLARERVEWITCVGDIVDGRGNVDRCVELLQAHNVPTVRGNHDRWLLDDPRNIQALFALAEETRDYLAALPRNMRFETAAGELCLCHAIGDDDMTFVHDDDAGRAAFQKWGARGGCSVVVAGHSHQRGAWRFEHTIWINAGTLRSGDNPCFGVVDFGGRFVQWYDLDEESRVLESELTKIEPTTGAAEVDAMLAQGPKARKRPLSKARQRLLTRKK
jgi:putative phosphoesterase